MADNRHNRDEAYTLQTPDDHRRYYDQWAQTYEDDFIEAEGYAYSARIALIARRLRPGFKARIADIGCGTGVVGRELRMQGFRGPIDGLDISEGMLKKAGEAGIYDQLHCTDLTNPGSFPETRYQFLISTGAFTMGHLGPDTLEEVFGLASRGAFALIGINAVFFEKDGFGAAFKEWEAAGRITPPVWFDTAIYYDLEPIKTHSRIARIAAFTIT